MSASAANADDHVDRSVIRCSMCSVVIGRPYDRPHRSPIPGTWGPRTVRGVPAKTPAARLVERIERRCRDGGHERVLRMAFLDEMRSRVGADWYAWLLTDPVTEVGSAPLAHVPSLTDLPGLIRAKYL